MIGQLNHIWEVKSHLNTINDILQRMAKDIEKSQNDQQNANSEDTIKRDLPKDEADADISTEETEPKTPSKVPTDSRGKELGDSTESEPDSVQA